MRFIYNLLMLPFTIVEWIIKLPFRMVKGIFDGIMNLINEIIMLPVKIVKWILMFPIRLVEAILYLPIAFLKYMFGFGDSESFEDREKRRQSEWRSRGEAMMDREQQRKYWGD